MKNKDAVHRVEQDAIRDYWVKLFFELAKGSYNILFLGALGLYFGKRGEIALWEMGVLMGGGIVLGATFSFLGYRVLKCKSKAVWRKEV
jgi:hypothetical protein